MVTGGVELAWMRTLLNVLWLVLAGIWLALGYVLAAVLMAITIIGIPFEAGPHTRSGRSDGRSSRARRVTRG